MLEDPKKERKGQCQLCTTFSLCPTAAHKEVCCPCLCSCVQLEPLKLREGQVLDVVVVGCGPAGLALAGELGRQGLTVGLLGRNSPFVNTYGVWPDEFQGQWPQPLLPRAWAYVAPPCLGMGPCLCLGVGLCLVPAKSSMVLLP